MSIHQLLLLHWNYISQSFCRDTVSISFFLNACIILIELNVHDQKLSFTVIVISFLQSPQTISHLTSFLDIVQSKQKVKEKFRQLMRRLLHESDSINSTGEDNMTPLHYAVLVSVINFTRPWNSPWNPKFVCKIFSSLPNIVRVTWSLESGRNRAKLSHPKTCTSLTNTLMEQRYWSHSLWPA